MFEKEAEEIANKKLCSKRICYNHCNFNSPKHHRCGEWHRCYESAKEGAEFGYNKANACHYPSMGDFPKTSGDMHKDWKPVLVYTKELGWTVGMRFKKNRKHEWYCSNYDGNTIFLDEEIFAWKELPELPKESE